MKIKFIKEYVAVDPATNSGIIHRFGETEEIKDYTAQWLIDNGFAEEVKESGWWKPKLGDVYYIAYPDGLVASCTWDGCTVDENRFCNGAVFKTEKATEHWRDYLKAIATVRQDDGVQTPEEIRERLRMPAGYCFCIVQSPNDASSMSIRGITDVIASAVYFDTEEHAQASLDKHPNEWKIIASYDWSRE